MNTRIRSVAVLGAGTMGAQIAAHFANAGVPVLLLDVSREAARDGLARARKLKPDPFFTPEAPTLVRTGGFEEDLAGIAASDWIVEAVIERLDVKQALLERVDRYRAPDAIVSSNTSGIPIAAIVEGRSPSFRAHALGTHFFNPPRYLRLVEIIRTPDTDPAVERAVAEFTDCHLGKGVVPARDTPNFIANRIGLYGVMKIFKVWGAPDAEYRSRRLTQSPVPRSAGQKARRSGRWIWRGSTCLPMLCGTWPAVFATTKSAMFWFCQSWSKS